MATNLQDSFSKASSPKQFQDALIELKILDAHQVELLRMESINSGRSIEEVGKETGLLDDEAIAKAKGKVMGLPYVDLRQQAVERGILQQIPESVTKNYLVVAFAGAGPKRLNVAAADPSNIQALEALQFVTKKGGLQVDLHIASPESIRAVMQQYGSLSGEVGEVLKESAKDDAVEDVKEDLESAKQLEKLVSDAPIAKAVGAILKYAAKQGASDIHIEPTEKDVKIRYRLDGVLVNTLNLPRSAHAALVSRIKILSSLKIDEARIPQDGRFNTTIDGHQIDFRVSTFPTVHGEKVVLRLLDKSTGLKSLEEIGITGRAFDDLVDGINKPYGMTLVTGPTGSGKSTTLYAALSRLNDVGVNIVTLEDPVEYDMDGINQSQINPAIGYDFANGLRSILRQDPDIVMVGEIRDKETAEMAVHAALTGHLVFSTLHTNDAAGALPRLVDMDIEQFLIASSINTIMAQRLVRKVCDHCKKPLKLSQSERDFVERSIATMPKQTRDTLKPLDDYTFVKGEGCDVCGKTGYKGRVGIFEVLPMTETIKELLLKNASGGEIKAAAVKNGMVTLQQDGVLKALKGITTLEEVMLRTKV
ncbi:type II/IV secretion system protein [Patescibacteria group bacterium]|nr:type II/IV secretion system protein [Patescibacteria group bacterium]